MVSLHECLVYRSTFGLPTAHIETRLAQIQSGSYTLSPEEDLYFSTESALFYSKFWGGDTSYTHSEQNVTSDDTMFEAQEFSEFMQSLADMCDQAFTDVDTKQMYRTPVALFCTNRMHV